MTTWSKLGSVAALLLVAFGASGATELDAKLLAAARGGQSAEVRELLAAGADANARGSDGSTPLLHAAHFGDMSSAEALLDELLKLQVYETVHSAKVPPLCRPE